MTLRLAELCAGYGGIGLALNHLGIDHTLEWYAEIDAHAAKVMEHHHPNAPNLGDLTKIGGGALPEADIMAAGFP